MSTQEFTEAIEVIRDEEGLPQKVVMRRKGTKEDISGGQRPSSAHHHPVERHTMGAEGNQQNAEISVVAIDEFCLLEK